MAGYAGVGTIFKRQTTVGQSPNTFTTVGGIQNISGPELAAEEIETTALDTAGGYKEYIGGLLDGGNVTLEALFLNTAAANTFRTDLTSRWRRNYQITWPTSPNATATFYAYVVGFSQSAEPNSALTASVTLRIDGAVTYA